MLTLIGRELTTDEFADTMMKEFGWKEKKGK